VAEDGERFEVAIPMFVLEAHGGNGNGNGNAPPGRVLH